ncbi:MAG: oligosaccharide flippase family protein [Candidatus Marinimicrobia bacterium]|nr:oligosaccharide flippase family protein [Candidatus Neomarinimicrobiota bacterium]
MAIRGQIKDIGKNTAVYGLGNLLSKFAAFLLIPLYTRYLTTSEVGIFALLEMLEKFLITVAPLGVLRAIWRFFPENKNEGQSQLIISGFIWTILINFVLLSILALNYKGLTPWFGLNTDNQQLIILVLLNIFLTLGGQFMLSLWQYQNKAFSFILLSLVQFVGILVLSILLVGYYNLGLWGLIAAKTIVLGVIFVFCSYVIVTKYWAFPSVQVYRNLLAYGVPLVLLALVTPVLSVASRIFLRHFVSLEEIGIYHIGYKFGMLINMFLVVPLQRGWMPMMYKMGLAEATKKIYPDVMFYYTVIGSFFFISLSLFIEPILNFVAQPAYLSGAYLVPIVAFAYFISGYRQFFTAGAALRDKTPRLALAAAGAISSNLVLNYFLIKYFSITGAAWSTLISYFILCTIVYFSSRNLAGIDWNFNRILKVIILTVLIFYSIFSLKELYPANAILLSFFGTIIFVSLLFILRIIGDREIKGLQSLIRQFRKI